MKKVFGERTVLKLIILIGIFALLFSNLQAQNTNSALNELDSRIELEFGFSKSSVAHYLREHEYSAPLSESITQFRMASMYGYYLDGRSGGDPQWLIIAEPLREVSNPDIFKYLSNDDCDAIAQFLEEHEYKNDPQITEEDIAPLVERLKEAVNQYIAQSSKPTDFSFKGTTFYYGEYGYDVTSRVEAINSILSTVPVGEKIVIECHVGPKNGVYCIFDTVSKSFEADLKGNHLIWYNDDITTAIYSFWSDVYTYDGSIIKSYDLAENEFIYDLAFSDNNTKLNVTIVCDDGTERMDIIDL